MSQGNVHILWRFPLGHFERPKISYTHRSRHVATPLKGERSDSCRGLGSEVRREIKAKSQDWSREISRRKLNVGCIDRFCVYRNSILGPSLIMYVIVLTAKFVADARGQRPEWGGVLSNQVNFWFRACPSGIIKNLQEVLLTFACIGNAHYSLGRDIEGCGHPPRSHRIFAYGYNILP